MFVKKIKKCVFVITKIVLSKLYNIWFEILWTELLNITTNVNNNRIYRSNWSLVVISILFTLTFTSIFSHLCPSYESTCKGPKLFHKNIFSVVHYRINCIFFPEQWQEQQQVEEIKIQIAHLAFSYYNYNACKLQ